MLLSAYSRERLLVIKFFGWMRLRTEKSVEQGGPEAGKNMLRHRLGGLSEGFSSFKNSSLQLMQSSAFTRVTRL